MDEQEAIARIKRGDVTGLEELVLRYQARAVHTAYLIVQDGPTAEDVVQGAFLQAYQKIGQFDDRRIVWFENGIEYQVYGIYDGQPVDVWLSIAQSMK